MTDDSGIVTTPDDQAPDFGSIEEPLCECYEFPGDNNHCPVHGPDIIPGGERIIHATE